MQEPLEEQQEGGGGQQPVEHPGTDWSILTVLSPDIGHCLQVQSWALGDKKSDFAVVRTTKLAIG